MKKLITVALLAAMGLSLVSCSNDGGSSSGSSASGSETSASASGTASAATVGTAVQLSQEADAESATFDAIFAAVLLDGDGKIIDCEIDQTEYQPTPDGAEVDVRSKMGGKRGTTTGWLPPALRRWNGIPRSTPLRNMWSA